MITIDIEQMYRQIELLKHLGRSLEGLVKQYQLNTFTYGAQSASYLVTKHFDTLPQKGWPVILLQHKQYYKTSMSTTLLLRDQAELKFQLFKLNKLLFEQLHPHALVMPWF